MTAITASHLVNFWKIRDICQGICANLSAVADDDGSLLESYEAESLFSDYKSVKGMIDKISSMGYFNKENVDEQKIATLVNNIIDVESKNSKIIAKIWSKDITKIKQYNKTNFKLAVSPLFADDINGVENELRKHYAKIQNFITAHLISNSNIKLTDTNVLLGSKSRVMPFGFVYDVNSSNFIAATDDSNFVTIKKQSEVSEKEFLAAANRGDEYLFIDGYAGKLKTPKQIIRKFSNSRFISNDNAVVLDGQQSLPCAIFYYSYGTAEINCLKEKLESIAKELNLPLIAVDVMEFYKQNGKFFSGSAIMRKCLNEFVDMAVTDVNKFSGIDCFAEVKKLVGYNTNMRYNFLYKFLASLKKHEKENTEALGEFVNKTLKKAVIKQNTLTKEREITNGAPLCFANEDTFIAVPKDFLGEHQN